MIKPKRKIKVTEDSFVNYTAAIGVGANNQLSQSQFATNPITRKPIELENAYRGNWVVAAAIDIPADDMTRAGIEIDSSLSSEEINQLQEAISDLNILNSLNTCLKWGSLYGGSLGYLMIDGQDTTQEIDLDSIDIGQFKGVMPLDRWMLQPDVVEIDTRLGTTFGLPLFYDVVADRSGFAGKWTRLSASRTLRFIGIELPFRQAMTENGWGESIIERLWDRLISFESVSLGAAQLAYKAHLRVMKIDGLRSIIAAGGPALKGLTAQMAFMRQQQANEGIALIDKDDDFSTLTYSFGGIAEIIDKFSEQISGCLQIPLTRLLGQSPGGLGSSGDSELQMYYDSIHKRQETRLRPALNLILQILSRSVLGKELPKGTRFKFKPLYMPTDNDIADVGNKLTNSITQALTNGIISNDEAREELKTLSEKTGLYTNLR